MFESLTITGTLWYQFVDRTSSLTFVSGLYIIIGSSVELFAYPHRGSDKTLVQISKSPHLAVYIGMIYSYTNEECLSCLLPYLLKLSDFYVRVNAKHFHVTNMLVTYSVTTQR